MTDTDGAGGRSATNLRVRFDAEDWQLLCKVSATEKLTKNEVIRRALRAYAPDALRKAQRRRQVLENLEPVDV
jgi:hypothetical protein